MSTNSDPEVLRESMKKSATVLLDADVPFALAGGLACWARGGAESFHDIDFVVPPDYAERAVEALAGAGLRIERGPEKAWLYKAFDGDAMVDIIFQPVGRPVIDLLADADEMDVGGVRMKVATVDDVLISKLAAMTETHMDFKSALDVARPLRERIDWEKVKAETKASPYALAFFTLVEALEIAPPS